MDYKRAIEYIVRRRKTELMDAQALYDTALDAGGELYEVELGIRAAKMDEVYGITHDPKKLSMLKRRKAELLKKAGLDDNMLSPPPHCSRCGDTGIADGRYCDCVKRLAINGESNIELPLRDFNDCSKEYLDLNGLRRPYDMMKAFSDKFPEKNNIKNVIMLGSTGTGKTYLSACVANEVLKKGCSVIFATAFGVQNRTLKYHTTFDAEKEKYLAPLLDCDLLVIDDLGTESILKNITLEYMYIIINERTIKNRHTIITTNLSMNDIASRYGQKFVSRLFDGKTSTAIAFTGKDLRRN